MAMLLSIFVAFVIIALIVGIVVIDHAGVRVACLVTLLIVIPAILTGITALFPELL